MKYLILFLFVATTHAAGLGSERFNGKYKLTDGNVKASDRAILQGLVCPPTLKITNIGRRISIDHPNLRAFDDGRLGQSLTELVDRESKVGDCAGRDPIDCLMHGTFNESQTKTTTTNPDFIVSGTYFRKGGERTKIEVTLSKMSSFLFYSVSFEERMPETFEKQSFKLRCSYQRRIQ